MTTISSLNLVQTTSASFKCDPDNRTQLEVALFKSPFNFTVLNDDACLRADDVSETPRATRQTKVGSVDIDNVIPSKSGLAPPDMINLQKHWKVIQDVDLDRLLGSQQLRTFAHPAWYLRAAIADTLNSVLQMISSLDRANNTDDSYSVDAYNRALKLSLLLPAMLLQSCGSESIQKKRLKLFYDLKWDILMNAVVEALQHSVVKNTLSSVDLMDEFDQFECISKIQKLGIKASKHIKDGELKKAKEKLTNPISFAAASEDTFTQLQAKHPTRIREILLEDGINLSSDDLKGFDIPETLEVTREIVWLAIRDAPRGASPGIDGLRMDHLYFTGNNGGAKWLDPMTELINKALKGDLPQWYYEFIAGANLVAIAKVPKGIRPIAMGSIWRKVMSSSALIILKDCIFKHFKLYQYGVGTKSGCEVVVQRARSLLTSNPAFVMVKTDFANAFNALLRKAMLEAVQKSFPCLYNFGLALYGPKSNLWANFDSKLRKLILSEEGVQQGDVLGPFLFCLTLQPILEELNSWLNQNGGGEILGFMDDLSIITSQETFHKLWPLLLDKSEAIGLVMNIKKCQVFSFSGRDNISEDLIPAVITRAEKGLVMLGVPVGLEYFCRDFWVRYVNDIEREAQIVCEELV
jgi:hypothetical protein